MLSLHVEPDTDGTAELFVEVKHASFSGASSAWFGIAELRSFGERLQTTFPIPQGTALTLQGGYWSKSGAPIEQLHVRLSFYPVGGSGTVGVGVTLATPIYRGDRTESQSRVAVEFATRYEALREFGRTLVALANGDIAGANLSSDSS
jgi:hypothetical protein